MVRLRNGQSFPKKEEEETTPPLPPARKKKASKRASNGVHEDVKPEKKLTPPPPPPAAGKRKRASKQATSTRVQDDDVKPETKELTPPPSAVGNRKRASKRATNTDVQDDDVKPETKKPPHRPLDAGKRKRASKQPASTGVQDDDVKAETKQSTPPPLAGRKGKRASKRASTGEHKGVEPDKRAAAKRELTVEDTDALNCGICFLPLKPPIFECEVGHVVCSACCKKTPKCHVCGGATSGFRRCHAMERLVESIQVPCPNSTHGCNAKLTYYEQQGHQNTCVMLSRLHCPGKACGFIGAMDALLAHLAGGVHHFSCTTIMRDAKYTTCRIELHTGFNFLRTNLPSATSITQFLFLLNLVWQPDGAVISVLCVQSRAAVSERPSLKGLKCELRYSGHSSYSSSLKGDLIDYHQSCKFKVACTDFSQGLPNLDERFQFLIPNFALEDGDMDTLKIGFNFKLD